MNATQPCGHADLECLNEFELIRKYRCLGCAATMMCSCDEDIGLDFLPHQLAEAAEYGTQRRVPVDRGFQPRVCRECRGLPAEPHPVAEIHGRTSKVKRYYWRELRALEYRTFRKWALDRGLRPASASGPEAMDARAAAAASALDEIKRLHATSPKYVFKEESQADVLRRHSVEVVDMQVTYARNSETDRAQVFDGDDRVSVEEYVIRHYARTGWAAVPLESRPFHVLFGVYMWLVIQDPADEHVRTVGVGDKRDFDAGKETRPIWFLHPDDFGTPGYGQRRAHVIADHLSPEMLDRKNLLWLFDYWLEPSWTLRNYLWAHRDEDVRTARLLVEILPPATVLEVLRYLAEDYWGRYLGWPDLFVRKQGDFFVAEVKSSGDKLSENQKAWIRDNASRLRLPFRVIKLHRAKVAE